MTSVPLLVHVDRIFDEKQRALDAHFDALRREVDGTARQLTARLETMNEFRQQITEERRLYVQTEVLDARLTPFDKRIGDLERARASAGGSLATLKWLWAAVGAVISGVVTLVLQWYGK